MNRISLGVVILLLCVQLAAAQKVPVQEVVLDNGMRLLLCRAKATQRCCRLGSSRRFGE